LPPSPATEPVISASNSCVEINEEVAASAHAHQHQVRREQFFLPLKSTNLKFYIYTTFHNAQKQYIPHKNLLRSDNSVRRFLTIDKNQNTFYCFVCLAFCDPKSDLRNNKFVNGYKPESNKHTNSRIEEHERLIAHKQHVEAMLLTERGLSLDDLISVKLVSKKREEIANRRAILTRLIEIVKFIGKRGLSYRAHSHEAAFSLKDETNDHGNFLELVLLLSKFDPILKSHVDKCVTASQKRKDAVSGSKGRGNLVTFLSKTMVNYIFQIIHEMMMELISKEVQDSEIFSVQVDSCQDISVKEQLSVVLRYVKDGRIFETFAGFLECKSTAGLQLANGVQKHFEKYDIDISRCCANATDGASNMQGEYNGFQAHLSEKSCNGQVHVWCHSHVLNLIILSICQGVLCVTNFFSLLNQCASHIDGSYIRRGILEELIDGRTMKRLALIGQTRWWAKERALTNIYGEDGIFVELVLTLEKISKLPRLDPQSKASAEGIADNLLSFNSILIAHLFMRIFFITTPLSKYLQTRGLDILQAQSMVDSVILQLERLKDDKASIFTQAKDFAVRVNSNLHQKTELVALTELPARRGRPRRRFHDEDPPSEEEVQRQALSKDKIFEIDVIDKTLNDSVSLLKQRFAYHKDLAADLHILNPTNFSVVKDLPLAAFTKLSEKITAFFPEFNVNDFKSELISFAESWPAFKKDVHSSYESNALEIDDLFIINDNEIREDECEEDYAPDEQISQAENEIPEFFKCQEKCSSSEGCPLCVFLYIERYNSYCLAYKNLWLAYKYVLTISIGQVECERSFSKMKYIKNRLRNSLSEDNFVQITQIYCERRLLPKISTNDVIDRLCLKSNLLCEMLTIK
jgi:Domain of unknown function (DUF4371)/hAT family C-terminal dimerisation region